jgi:endonuclease YncB( thermonuclease family)
MIFALLAAAACATTGCSTPLPPPEPIAGACSATDGDTLRCGDERIRLLGIDAPEMRGHCRNGRECAPGDPLAAKSALALAIQGKVLAIRRTGRDLYGRTLGVVYVDGRNLSCGQLSAGQAIYVRKWDPRDAVRRDCPALASPAGPGEARTSR